MAGLYIHIPFCATKCPYCDFYSVTDRGLTGRWLDSLAREMEYYAPLFDTFDTIYLGGGTPSLLAGEDLSHLFSLTRRFFHFSPDTEITIELNPDDVTDELLHHYFSLGVNRLSLGIQSFSDRDLRFLGRRHDAHRAVDALRAVNRAGFDNFGIDLIYGLKGQKRQDWVDNLERATGFGPAHLSCYQLTVEEHTPFGKRMKEGSLQPLRESSARRLFLDTSRYLGERGFIHYEISNFALTEDRVSRHNSKYWNHTPYLGLGPAAHSFLKGKRWWNHRSLVEYCVALEGGNRPVHGSEELTPAQLRLEALYFGFRTAGGLDAAELAPDRVSRERLGQLRRSRLVRVAGSRVLPTEKGFLVADGLPLLFGQGGA